MRRSRSRAYELSAVVVDVDRLDKITSKPVRIRIVAPSAADIAAYDYIRGSDATFDLFSGRKSLEGESHRLVLEELARSYSQSRFADYANLLLGRNFLYRHEYARAVEHFTKLEQKAGFPLAGEVASSLVKARARLKG